MISIPAAHLKRYKFQKKKLSLKNNMANLNNFFTDKNAIKTIDLFRVLYFVVAVLAFFMTEAGRKIYRPFIYENGINDFGIADSIGNLGGIIVQIYFSFALLNSSKKKGFRVIGFIVIGYILYEILQPFLPRGVLIGKIFMEQ